jgi:hypothetical protein
MSGVRASNKRVAHYPPHGSGLFSRRTGRLWIERSFVRTRGASATSRSLEGTAMPTPLELYKSFVDDLVGMPRNSVRASRARRGFWNPNRPSRKDSEILRRSLQKDQQYNQLLRELSAGQREVLAQMLQEEHNSGVFAVLSYQV